MKTYKMYRYLKKQTIMFMKRMTYTTKFMSAFAIVTLLALLTACRDEADDVIQPGVLTADKSLTEQFDAIWHGINQNYVFWEADPTRLGCRLQPIPSALRGAGQAGSGSYRRLAETV